MDWPSYAPLAAGTTTEDIYGNVKLLNIMWLASKHEPAEITEKVTVALLMVIRR